MVIFFNVKLVREYLIKHGEVFTIRKKRFRIGNDIAVYGNYKKHTTFAKVYIKNERGLYCYRDLYGYVQRSGLYDKKWHLITNSKKWYTLASRMHPKLSRLHQLYLYYVTIRGPPQG